jgi:hypothetical protein
LHAAEKKYPCQDNTGLLTLSWEVLASHRWGFLFIKTIRGLFVNVETVLKYTEVDENRILNGI